MMRVLLLCLSFSIAGFAQPWLGIIASNRAMDWRGAGVKNGIPSRTTICTTLGTPGQLPTFAQSVTAAQINSAISTCTAGQVVFLNTGTYTMTAFLQLFTSSVTLRGAGPSKTILKFTSTAPGTGTWPGSVDVAFGNSNNFAGLPNHLTTWTAGYAKGTTRITLGSVTGLAVGQLIILDQANDLLDTNQVFVCDNLTADASHTGCTNSTSGGFGSPGRTVSSVDYNLQEYKVVQAINAGGCGATCVDISPPLYMPNWRTAQLTSAWWADGVVHDTGIENLTLDHTGGAPTINTTGAGDLIMWNTYNCWLSNVRSLVGTRNHVWIQMSARISIVNSYFWGTLNSATLSYGVEPWMSGDLLIQNNVFHNIVTPVLIGPAAGSVIAYNYSTNDTTFSNNPAWQMPGPPWNHDVNEMTLIEGNEGTGVIMDTLHGTTNFMTVFRNFFSGLQAAVKNQNTSTAVLESHNRYINFIGNVQGTGNYHTTYQVVTPTTANCDLAIFNIGSASGQCLTDTVVPEDSLVATTLMRWGNYDTVNNATRFVNTEVPSSFNDGSGSPSLFVNPVPASQTLPESFYTTCATIRASWYGTPFGNPPCPAMGPDVIGGILTAGSGASASLGGHANPLPAHLCFTNTATDTNYGTGSTITAASGTSTTATITIGSNAANVVVSSSITVTGVNPAAYNCTHCNVTAQTATTVTYAVASNPGTYVSGGLATWPDILAFDASACYQSSINPPASVVLSKSQHDRSLGQHPASY